MNTLSKENRQVGCELISLNIKLKKNKGEYQILPILVCRKRKKNTKVTKSI